MVIQDPTITALASYNLGGAEAFIGLIVLAVTIISEMLNKLAPPDRSDISTKVTRTPEEAFEGVLEAEGSHQYLYIEHGGQWLRIHYVDEGHRDGKVLLCLHGEPFWSQSYRRHVAHVHFTFLGFGYLVSLGILFSYL